MNKKLLRLAISLAVLAVALFAFTSSNARAATGSCRNVAPFCSNYCSCGGMRCNADCTAGCDFPGTGSGSKTVWCEDIS